MIAQLKVPLIKVLIPILLLLLLNCPTFAARTQKPLSTSVQIVAPPEVVFQAIRRARDSTSMHRKLLSYDGKVAKIKENLEGVPIYGNVECIWEETEFPFEKIAYKMISSNKFKSGSGMWILTPSSDKRSTNLELQSSLDSGLRIPFASEMTKMSACKDNKERLKHIKDMAEAAVNKIEMGEGVGRTPKK